MSADFDEGMRRIDALIADLEDRGGEEANAARDLVRAVLDLHEAGLARALTIIGSHGEAGRVVLASLERDPQVSSLLLLHGLHSEPMEVRVRRAAEAFSAGLAPRSRVEIDSAGPLVRARLVGGSNSGARAKLEEALLAAAPDAESIEVDEIIESPLLPIERLVHKEVRGPT